MKALNEAIEVVGGVTSLAKKLGIRQSAVSNWMNRGRVPADKCLGIELATEGKIRCHELRPDVFPAPEKSVA